MAAPTLKFVAVQKSSATATLIPLEDIPEDIKAQAEEVFTTLKTNDGSLEVSFDTKTELLTYEKQMRSYGEQRMVDGKPAPIYYRRSPAKNLPENTVRFRITDTPAKNKDVKDGINNAVDAVKTAAKKTAAAAK